MRNLFKNSILSSVLVVLSNFGWAEEGAPAAPEPVTDDEIAYFFGYRFGNALIQGGNSEVNPEVVMQGLKDALQRAEPNLSVERQPDIIAAIQERQQALQAQQIAQLAEMSKAFLAQNRDQEGVNETSSGLQYQVVTAGSGKAPSATDRVTVHYEGRLINGQVFDSSIQRGEPATFGLNQVIPGWTEGLQLMKEGGKMRFFIPPELGYGPGGTRNIPPHAVLVFEVELLEVLATEADPAG